MRRRTLSRIFIILVLTSVILTGCSNYSIEKPSGFAVYENGNTQNYFSPDGVKLKIRSFQNKPQQDSDFWGKVLKKHLEKKGYRLLSENRDAEKGSVSCLWIIASGKDYFMYMTTVISEGKTIVVAEAAGKKSEFERYSDIINKSVSTIKIK
jgi:hypothetical protein